MVKPSGYLKLTDGPDDKNQASLSGQERNSRSIMTRESHDMSPGSGVHTSQSNQEVSSVSVIPGKESEAENHGQNPDAGVTISKSYQKISGLPIVLEKVSDASQQTLSPDASVPASQSDQENYAMVLRPDKGLDKLPLRRNPDSAIRVSHSDQGVIFSRLPEKPTLDGYNWRKYGQKLVRGNAFVRSYYKCTFANCPARKQVEHSHDGHITEINYLWKHEHPNPQHTPPKSSENVLQNEARASDEPSLTSKASQDPEESETHLLSVVASSENFVEVAVSHSSESEMNNIPPDSKRQKRDSSCVNGSVVTKTNYEPRVVVQTRSAVDIVNDGYRWRKYGQKLVKGNPNPRSYYRCSSNGCTVKKHVERASHDEKVVITTYEGRHDHDMPAGTRIVTQNTQGNNISTSSFDDDEESEPQPEANESTGMEMVVHVGAN